MNPAGRLSAVILLSGFLSGMPSVEGSRKDCPTAAIVNLTGIPQDFFGSVYKSGDVFPREAVWIENGETFGCPCDLKKCLRLCCPMDDAIRTDGCVEERDIGSVLSDEKDIHAFIDEPCSMDHPLVKSWRSIAGSNIDEKTLEPPFEEEEDGHYKPQNFSIILVGVCIYDTTDSSVPWFFTCVNISMLFVLATFIVYSVIPELKNFQGLIFRCYLATYICCIVVFTIFISMVIFTRPTTWLAELICILIPGYGIAYFGGASMLWLNVMSIDIWRTFRKLRSSRDVNMEKRQKKKFVRYSIYVWSGSTAIIPILFFISRADDRAIKIWLYVSVALTAAISFSNVCLYVLTALKIKQRKKETAHVVGGANKHHQENEQWFNLYVKLFLIMGGPLILWAIAIYCRNPILSRIVYTIEGTQGIFIFLIFVWKEDVKKLLRRRFSEGFRRLGSNLRRDSTPEIEISRISR